MDADSPVSPHNEHLDKVLQIVGELAEKAAGADYIYRGETQWNPQISSSFYRDLPVKPPAGFDVDQIQVSALEAARSFTFEDDELTILSELQHYGGKTNLIDFTADCHIALFFACDGRHTQDGRIIFLKRDGDMQPYIHGPRNPVNRIIAQKSVFVRPPSGYVDVDRNDIINIPSHLKRPILDYLRKTHGISAEKVYNDLHGYIRYAEIHQDAFKHLLAGFTKHQNGDYIGAIDSFTESIDLNPSSFSYINRGLAYTDVVDYDNAIADYDRAIAIDPNYADTYHNRGFVKAHKGDYDGAVADYDRAIALDPNYAYAYNNRGIAKFIKGDYASAIDDFSRATELDTDNASAYSNRGESWLHLSEWDNARADLTVAKDMGIDIADSFRNAYASVADFERRTSLTLPDDIAEMLGG